MLVIQFEESPCQLGRGFSWLVAAVKEIVAKVGYMRLPTLQGVIDRRMLVNYRVDAAVAARLLPSPFRPNLIRGFAMAGICLIRLKQIRPTWLPIRMGMSSENAAHRFAVEWDQEGRVQEGVFIPRRDTNSRLNVLFGGRLFPGEHHAARFNVTETDDRLELAFTSEDSQAQVNVVARLQDSLPAGSVFESLDEASLFFQGGALGYSATADASRYDGLELRCKSWRVQSLAVERVQSSYFDDTNKFPPGSVTFDCALLMRGVEHEWKPQADLCCVNPT